MAIIWVLEKPKTNSLVADLIGDFAVRAFASPSSFKSMLQTMSELRLPDCLVIDGEDFAEQVSLILAYCDSYLGDCRTLILFGEGSSQQISLKPHDKLRFLMHDFSSFDLCREIRNFVRVGAHSAFSRTLKDLQVDSKKMAISISGIDEERALSSKELQLLLFFMEHSGQCLSRDQIRLSVWNGLAMSLRTIDTHISRLRKKLEDSSVELKSVYGGGYVLE